jgi:hypothetical protein
VHIIIRGKLPPEGRRKGQVEMYDAERYFTITGQHLEGTPLVIEPRQAELDMLHRATWPERLRGGMEEQPTLEELLNRTTRHWYTVLGATAELVMLSDATNLAAETLRDAQGDAISVPILCGMI